MSAPSLHERLAAKGTALARREEEHREGVDQARTRADALRAKVAAGLAGFDEAVEAAGAPHLRVSLGPVRTDEKHVRAVEFEAARGRHRALFIVKSRGQVTLVGPFRTGKVEGPCQSLPWDAEAEIDEAVAAFLERFLEEAATP